MTIDRVSNVMAATVGECIGFWGASFFVPIYPDTFIAVSVFIAFMSWHMGWLD
jgi:hypothetical protein